MESLGSWDVLFVMKNETGKDHAAPVLERVTFDEACEFVRLQGATSPFCTLAIWPSCAPWPDCDCNMEYITADLESHYEAIHEAIHEASHSTSKKDAATKPFAAKRASKKVVA